MSLIPKAHIGLALYLVSVQCAVVYSLKCAVVCIVQCVVCSGVQCAVVVYSWQCTVYITGGCWSCGFRSLLLQQGLQVLRVGGGQS